MTSVISQGAAEVLAKIKNKINGEIRFIFQPAEEGYAGAKYMIEASNDGPINKSIQIGEDVGKQLIKKGALEILKSCS